MPQHTYPNRFLTLEEMEENVLYFRDLMYSSDTLLHWTLEALAGLFGNAQVESTINPGLWAGGVPSPDDKAYGLVQWYPGKKYIDWCFAAGYPWDVMEGAAPRLQYEIDNPREQWLYVAPYQRTMLEYATSTMDDDPTFTPQFMAAAFNYCYERPGSDTVAERQRNAVYWYEFLENNPYVPPSGPLGRKIIFMLKKRIRYTVG